MHQYAEGTAKDGKGEVYTGHFAAPMPGDAGECQAAESRREGHIALSPDLGNVLEHRQSPRGLAGRNVRAGLHSHGRGTVPLAVEAISSQVASVASLAVPR